FGNEWLPLYIGMVYNQCVSERHSAPDHKARMEKLQKRFPESIFYITLGTPQFISGRLSQNTIKEIEQLLIYCNWNDKMINAKEINAFDSSKQIRIINEGFIEHICQESVYGVFYR
ncbi:MAG: hypothetical protein L6246_07240, partial [Thermodesulfovibrionales bacterium]|nr:hypothetical protein [Thermodesulfovibrionales bacterium]